MACVYGLDRRVHSLSEELLRLRWDHLVFRRDEIPRGNVPPCRSTRAIGKANNAERLLDGCHHGRFRLGGIGDERLMKAIAIDPKETIAVRRYLRRSG